jgi:RNA polymerase sigma factor (sigma-70 family)
MSPRADPSRLGRLALRCQPDSRLVELSREGSEAAFEEIVTRYRSGLVGFAGAIVPQHRAEDVVQEALAKAHTAISAGDAEINLRPWLFTIVRNRALNDLRDQPVHDHLDENYDGVPQPPAVAARRAELAALVTKLKALPEAQRQALVQRELEGRSHEEIATALATTPGAVRGLIFRARGALRDGAGMLVPMSTLRYLIGLSGSSAGVGAAAGGGTILKIGTGLTVAALAVGSGVALKDHESGRDATADAAVPANLHAHSHGSKASSPSFSAKTAAPSRGGERAPGSNDGSSHGSSGPGPAGGSSNEGSGGGSAAPAGGSSGAGSGEPEPGDGGGGHSGPGGGGSDDGGGGTSTHHGGDDGGTSSGPGGGGSDGSDSGSDDGGTTGSSGDGSSGDGSSGDGSGSGSDDGSSNSGPGGGGSDGSGSGSGDGGGDSTTPTTTTPLPAGGEVTPPADD